MASIYKKSRDKGRKNAPYYIDYTDESGRRKTIKGPTDKAMANSLAAKLENDALLKRKGLIDPKLEQMAVNRNSTIKLQLEEFERQLRRRKRSSDHIQLVISRIDKIVEGCKIQRLAQLSSDPIEAFIAEYCDYLKLGPKTFNHYCQAIEQFTKWLYKRKMLDSNPVLGLPRRNCAVDVRRQRRSLTLEELGKLIDSARKSGLKIQCYDGETRARIYLASYFTGLRRKELASLTRSSFKFEAEPAVLIVDAIDSKHRQKDLLPIHPELLRLLPQWLEGLGPEQALFPKLAKRRTSVMVKKDLERVGIPYLTKDGYADFHAAGRRTYIQQLNRQGASLTATKDLARHTTTGMTERYLQSNLNEMAATLSALPVPCQYIVSEPAVFERNQLSSVVTDVTNDHPTAITKTVEKVGRKAKNDAEKRKGASAVTDAPEWRRFRGLARERVTNIVFRFEIANIH